MVKKTSSSTNKSKVDFVTRLVVRSIQLVIFMTYLLFPRQVQAASLAALDPVPPTAPRMQSGGWYDPAWTYRRPIPISNSGALRSDYQVLITLTGSFDFNHAASDGRDVRFTNQSGTSLPFWIESWDSAATLARIWVRVDSIPTTGATLYLYYGNPAASTASSGANTFEFFDTDWLNLTSRWHVNGGTPVPAGEIISFSSGATMQSLASYSPGHALGYRAWFKSGGGAYKWGGFLNGVSAPYTYIGTVADPGLDQVILTNNLTGTRGSDNLGFPTDTFHIYEMTWTPTVVRAFLDRSTTQAGLVTTYVPSVSLPIQLGNYNDNDPAGETFEVDWVYLRNYAEPEPALAVGTEEENQSADLQLAIADSPDPAMAGASLTYTITVTNLGPLTATGAVLTDILPANVTFISATPSQGTACTGSTTIICDLGTILNGAAASVSVVVQPTAAGILTNSPSVTSAVADYNPTNNAATASTVVNDSTTTDLRVTQTDSPDPVKAGQPLTYTLTVTNLGPGDATGVSVTNTLPSNITYNSATSTQGTCTHPGNVVCTIGAMSGGASVTITIIVTPLGAGTIINTAVVSGSELDLISANNTSSENTRVTAPSLGAVVLVNSNSAGYGDFEHFIQPYLEHFGVPYTVLDIATTPVASDVQDYALIIIGHRQIDVTSAYLSLAEQAFLTAAVNGGGGLMNFDNDLSANGVAPRYQFIQDVFNFSYQSPPSGSGVLFPSAVWPHFITNRHAADESIVTGSMTLAGITLPTDAIALATTAGVPFLAVRDYGSGHAVQWGTYSWMSHSVKGPIFGLDDLVWRGMAWAARKPFIMQGLPPFLTMRVDDESGPFDWIHVANEFGIKPWAGVFLSDIDPNEAADLSNLVNAGQATTSIHAFNGEWFYWQQTEAQMTANFLAGTNWHNNYNIPISKYVLPHYYQFGTNAFQRLADWGVECVGTQMVPGTAYGAAWVMSGPFRKFETGSSSGAVPQYAADYLTIPDHPELEGRFFNLVTEIRDDAGYEWFPTTDVINTVTHGTTQTKRALDSMALATLFTHDQHISPIPMGNWRSILQGITTNLASYNMINVTMDDACLYVKSKFNSKISSSSYDSASRQVTVNYTGTTSVPTKFYLFMEDQGVIRDLWVDVPQFSGQEQVLFTLPGALNHIVVSPEAATVVAGATQQFTAQGYDIDNNLIPNLPFVWSAASEAGTISSSGLFTAGATPGTYTSAVTAALEAFSDSTSVTVTAPALHHFQFQTIPSPQYAGAPFQVTITARDSANNLFSGFTGTVLLSASAGTITPETSAAFANGSWSGNVTLDGTSSAVTLTATAGSITGTSNSFALQPLPTLDHFTIAAISSPQIVNAPFQISITARDASNNPLPVYTGTPALSASAGSITPTVTGSFVSGVWVGTVTLDTIASSVTITVSDGSASGISNSFEVQPPPPYYQVTSANYSHSTNSPFAVTVTGYQTQVNLGEDNHQYPVLSTVTDSTILDYNATAGQWTEFHYTLGRDFPSIMASATYSGTLPTMQFYANGIPNGRYQVIANLYDNARMRYFYGYTSGNPAASYVDTAGGATGTEHREYNLGIIDITDNTFNLYVNNADWLGGMAYHIFGWAWVRLAPVQPPASPDIIFSLADDGHQDPLLATTTDAGTLNLNNHLWTEFLYIPSRTYATILGPAANPPMPTMHFYHSTVPNGEYRVYGLLYTTNPFRYYYGYSSANPQEFWVDTTENDAGEQHAEYLLGTVTVTNGRFDLYVNRADQLSGDPYFFGWARIRLSPTTSPSLNVTLSSDPAGLLFDGDANGTYGESGDNILPLLVNFALTTTARSATPGQYTITATDIYGNSGSQVYTLSEPTAVTLSSFTGDTQFNLVQLNWETASEVDLIGFNVYRSEAQDGTRQQLNTSLLRAHNPGQMEGGEYQYFDAPGLGRTYYYWLELVFTDRKEITGPVLQITRYLVHLPWIGN